MLASAYEPLALVVALYPPGFAVIVAEMIPLAPSDTNPLIVPGPVDASFTRSA